MCCRKGIYHACYLFAVLILLSKPVISYAKYKNSYFKFSDDKIEFINGENIISAFEPSQIAKITKIPQMAITWRQSKSKILSFILNIFWIFLFFVLVLLFFGLNLQDFFKFCLILLVIVLFYYFFYAISQNIYQIYNSKFGFFKFANLL